MSERLTTEAVYTEYVMDSGYETFDLETKC